MLSVPEVGKRRKQVYVGVRSFVDRSNVIRQAEILLGEVLQNLKAFGNLEIGAAFVRFIRFHEKCEGEVEFGYFLHKAPSTLQPPYRIGTIPSGKYARANWTGSRNQLCDMHDMFIGWVKQVECPVDWTTEGKWTIPESYLICFPNIDQSGDDEARWAAEVALKLKG